MKVEKRPTERQTLITRRQMHITTDSLISICLAG